MSDDVIGMYYIFRCREWCLDRLCVHTARGCPEPARVLVWAGGDHQAEPGIYMTGPFPMRHLDRVLTYWETQPADVDVLPNELAMLLTPECLAVRFAGENGELIEPIKVLRAEYAIFRVVGDNPTEWPALPYRASSLSTVRGGFLVALMREGDVVWMGAERGVFATEMHLRDLYPRARWARNACYRRVHRVLRDSDVGLGVAFLNGNNGSATNTDDHERPFMRLARLVQSLCKLGLMSTERALQVLRAARFSAERDLVTPAMVVGSLFSSCALIAVTKPPEPVVRTVMCLASPLVEEWMVRRRSYNGTVTRAMLVAAEATTWYAGEGMSGLVQYLPTACAHAWWHTLPQNHATLAHMAWNCASFRYHRPGSAVVTVQEIERQLGRLRRRGRMGTAHGRVDPPPGGYRPRAARPDPPPPRPPPPPLLAVGPVAGGSGGAGPPAPGSPGSGSSASTPTRRRRRPRRGGASDATSVATDDSEAQPPVIRRYKIFTRSFTETCGLVFSGTGSFVFPWDEAWARGYWGYREMDVEEQLLHSLMQKVDGCKVHADMIRNVRFVLRRLDVFEKLAPSDAAARAEWIPRLAAQEMDRVANGDADLVRGVGLPDGQLNSPPPESPTQVRSGYGMPWSPVLLTLLTTVCLHHSIALHAPRWLPGSLLSNGPDNHGDGAQRGTQLCLALQWHMEELCTLARTPTLALRRIGNSTTRLVSHVRTRFSRPPLGGRLSARGCVRFANTLPSRLRDFGRSCRRSMPMLHM